VEVVRVAARVEVVRAVARVEAGSVAARLEARVEYEVELWGGR
jgi:hypothetical protein